MPGLSSGVVLMALAYAAAWLPAPVPRAAPWLMTAGLILTLLSLLILGTGRRGRGAGERRRPVLLICGLGFVILVLGAGFTAALALPAETPATGLWLGLPRRAALLLYGIGLLPALVLPLVYGLSFGAAVLTEAELAEWREELAKLRRDTGEA